MKQRIYFIMADENVFHPIFVARVIKAIGNRFDVVGITLAKDTYKKGLLSFLGEQLRLWGILGFSFIAFRSIIHRLLSKLGFNKDLSYKTIAKSQKIAYFETYDVNARAHLDFLKKLNIDIILCSCGQIFKKELLSIPKIACINRHASLLPKYGGMLPVFWAMYFEEREFGVSIHKMTEKVDQGDIIAVKKTPLQKQNSMFHNYILSFQEAVGAAVDALNNVTKGSIVGKFYHNDKEYFSSPTPENIREFKRKGLRTFAFLDIFSRL